MITDLDWDFIGSLEGKSILTGYVPVGGKSGVTVATGVDLGQQSYLGMRSITDDQELISKLAIYFDLRGYEATEMLEKAPLKLTQEEADKLDRVMYESILKTLKTIWGNFSARPFEELPKPARTILFSLAWNFGPYLHLRIPTLLLAALRSSLKDNWSHLEYALHEYKGNPELQPRRQREANYLATKLLAASVMV